MTKRIVLRFPSQIVDKPLLYHLVKDFGLMVNVLKANVNPRKEGFMVMELSGEPSSYDQGIDFLKKQGVTVEKLAEDIVRDVDRCTHCGHCTSLCPVGALYIIRPSMEVAFDEEKCIVCGLCLKACPVKAIELNFNGR
ncbi:NIL domain-containing protein [Thermincola ferriacetica]